MALFNLKQPFFGLKNKKEEPRKTGIPFLSAQTPFYPTPTGTLSPKLQALQGKFTTQVHLIPKPGATSPIPLTTPKTVPEATKGVYFEVDGKKLYSPTGLKYDAIPAEQAPKPTQIPPQSTQPQQPLQQPFPPEPPKPTGTDYEKLYNETLGIQKKEADEAKAREEQKFQETQTARGQLIEKSESLFNDLFKGQDVTMAKEDRAKARENLSRIDAEEVQALNQFTQQAQTKGVPSWAFSRQSLIIQNDYDARRATFAANEKIAQGRLDDAMNFAKTAYDHNLNILNAKIDLAEQALTRATGLKKDEKEEYLQAIKDAKEAIKQKEKEKEDSLDLYIQFSKAGVKNISPDMSVEALQRASGPILANLAQQELSRKRKTEVEETTQKAAISSARSELERTKGTDGYIDPERYMELRTDYAEAVGDPSKFDEAFASRLSPQERARLGIGKAVGVEAVKAVGEELVTEEFVRSRFTKDELITAAKEAGFTAGGFLGIGVGDKGVQDYINWLIQQKFTKKELGF